MSSVNKNNRLGRGLDSLLGPSTKKDLEVFFLDIERVSRNENQPRKQFAQDSLEELSESIKKHGILQPILVQAKADKYQIIAGERRWRAAALAGLHKIPVIVKSPKPEEAPLWALLENLQRKDLNPMEEARAFSLLLKEQKITQESLARTLGVSRSSLANSLRLLQLDEKVQGYIEEGRISFSQAKEILGVKEAKEQRRLADLCINGSLTVRQMQKKKTHKKNLGSRPPWLTKSISYLEGLFARKVQIDFSSKGRGKLSLSFHSEEELKDILDKLWTIKK